ncbi:MAG: acyltransferase [Clostridium perfringens]|nr:acyltransferase [Clostridium perfringens]
MKKILRKIINIYYFIVNKINFKINNIDVYTNIRSNIRGILYIKNNGKCVISKEVRINSRYSANPIGGQEFCTMIIGENGNIFIDEGAAISNSTIVSNKEVYIGKNVFIGGDCKIYDTDFHSINLEDRIKEIDNNIKSKKVVIEDGAFIGTGSIILKGVKIGREAIIGAGSVVSKDIPSKQIWGGNPAKFLKNIDDK